MTVVRLAVLMSCHNRAQKTRRCLERLSRSRRPSGLVVTLFVVDDGSTDHTRRCIFGVWPEANLISGDGNLFWNGGMRRAWAVASQSGVFDYYLWLNDDVEVLDDFLMMLICEAERYSGCAIICGATCSRTDRAHITYSGYSSKGGRVLPSHANRECDYCNGNIVLIPRRVFDVVGNLSPHYRHSLGDFDYGVRARASGFKIVVAPGVCGVCDANDARPLWLRAPTPFQRLKALYEPLGCHPIEHFRFERLRAGFWLACLRFASIHARAIMPQAWGSLKSAWRHRSEQVR